MIELEAVPGEELKSTVSQLESEVWKRKAALLKEQSRVATEIGTATQTADIDALVLLFPRRDVIAHLLRACDEEEKRLEALRTEEWEMQQRRESLQGDARRLEAGNRAMALHHARTINAEWNFAMPLANVPENRGEKEQRRAAALAQYEKLIRENDLQNWELAGKFDPQGNWIPGV